MNIFSATDQAQAAHLVSNIGGVMFSTELCKQMDKLFKVKLLSKSYE